MKKQPTINPNDFVSVESGSEDVYIPLDEEIDVYDVDKAIDEVNGVVVAGSTEDKVEYLDETKTDIREAIINQGVDVGEDDPFRLYAEKISEIEGGEINNQDKTITENGTYTADAGCTGLGQVVVDVPSEEPVLETLNVSGNGTYIPSGNVDGYDEVIVDVQPVLEDISVSENGTYTASSGYDGLGEVVVNTPVINNQDKNISQNGTYTADSGYSGLGEVSVNVQPVLEDKTIRVNGTYTAGEGYDGLGEVVVDVADIPAVVEPLSVSPTTSQQIITPPVNVDGFNQVTVSAVTSSIDENITAGNIKSGVSILGVQGNVVELDGETTTVSPTTSQQVITPTGQHNGLTEVTIEAVDASIDSDIVAGNIKSGVNILGVSGSVVELNADSLSVSPTTSAQMITPTSPYNAFNEVSVSAVTSSIDSNITAGNIKSGVSILGVNGSVVELDGETTTVTPTTSQQTITPSGVHNGLTEVVVDAVDSTIDSNIQSGNIKSGVSILGVSGNVVELNGGTASVTPTTSSQVITPTSPVNGFTRIEVDAVDSSIDANITSANIVDGVSILGVTGSAEVLDGEQITITPTTSQQVITPSGNHNGITEATVSAVTSAIDSNIVAGNIKDGVTILGVTGTYTGSGPVHYIQRNTDANGKLVTTGAMTTMDFTGVIDVGDYCMLNAYYNNTDITGTALRNASSLVVVSGDSAFSGAWSGCSGITRTGLNNVVTVSGYRAFGSAFSGSGVVYADLDNLEVVSGQTAFETAFNICPNLVSTGLHNLREVSGSAAFQGAFNTCQALTDAGLENLESVTGRNAFGSCFYQCDAIQTVTMNKLKVITEQLNTSSGGYGMFASRSMSDLYLGGLESSTFATRTDQLKYLLGIRTGMDSATGCTIHFPSNFDPADPNHTFDASTLDGYPNFGGQASLIHIAYDLPATE